MFEVRRPIANFRMLVLGVLSNMTPGDVHKNSWVTQTLSKESLELNPRQGSHFFSLVPTLVLVPTKADPITKEQRALAISKWSSRFLGPSCWPTGLRRLAWAWKERSMQNIVIVQRSSSVYLAEAMVGTGSHALLGMKPLIWRSPYGHLDCYTQLSVAESFCENESRVPSLWSGVWYRLTELLQIDWLTRWVWRN